MINEKYLELLNDFLKRQGMDKNPTAKAKGLFFGFLMTYREDFPFLEDFFLDQENRIEPIFPYDEFQLYQINLCTVNTTSSKLELRVPFISGITTDEFSQFLERLAQYNITSTGHANKRLSFSIFDGNREVDKTALGKAKLSVKDFDLDKAAKVVSQFYEYSEYASKLASYLSGASFTQDYNAYV